MTAPPVRIEVLVCTFRRPALAATLASLAAQRLPEGVALAVIVADNDGTPSARALAEAADAAGPHRVRYLHAPERNISIARNACLDAATADWVAFVDDDETAPPDWIAQLWAREQATGADAVFGPALASYPAGTPDWIRAVDLHSNRPERRAGRVMTGHTCNALLRWAGAPWQDARFDLSRGRAGGEDTAFFFALHRRGARFEIAEDAPVHEVVAPERLRPGWLFRRRFRMGQSYVSSTATVPGRIRLAALAGAKAAFSAGMTILTLPFAQARAFWALRATLHAGVVAGCLRLPEHEAYGR